MGSKLLVRSYNVGCGDCIYVRIPDGDDHFHVLIDCGSKEGANTGVMGRAIKHLEDHELPPAGAAGKKRLDLIVVTHRHEDHIKGFDPKFFKNIAIGNIWMTAAMDEKHEQATGTHALHDAAKTAMRGLAGSGAALSPELEDLAALYGISNKGAMSALLKKLPAKNRAFVHAGQTSADFGIQIEKTKITVLAPELDIDGVYLGKENKQKVLGAKAGAGHFSRRSKPAEKAAPANITAADFRTLQSRLLSSGLAFAVDDSSIQNNVSTVLLIEWGQRRLLFVGDAEWEDEYEEGKKNGSWNVMWNKRRELLDKPVDFLKVGHHGSHNATPWNRDAGPEHEVNQILDAILPLPPKGKKPTAQCIVSTKRKQYDTIPDAHLLTEIGRRVSNTRNYLQEFKREDPKFDPAEGIFNYSKLKTYSKEPKLRQVGELGYLDKPQPRRTDMESAGKGQEQMLDTVVEYIDVEVPP